MSDKKKPTVVSAKKYAELEADFALVKIERDALASVVSELKGTGGVRFERDEWNVVTLTNIPLLGGLKMTIVIRDPGDIGAKIERFFVEKA